MIMIDDKKTVIAGDAAKIITELATVMDRLLHEISSKPAAKITYEELHGRFNEVINEVRILRGDREDLNPNEIIDSGKIKKILPEKFFNLADGAFPKNDTVDATSLLQDALKKLSKSKKKMSKSKKKNKKK